MAKIKLNKRVKYAGDVHTELLKAGWDLETAALFLNNIPDATDVVEVIRCKDCIGCSYEDGQHWCGGGLSVHPVKPDDFCSYGERKGGE